MSKSQTTTKYKEGDRLPPIHPGVTLKEDFMVPLGLSAQRLSLLLGVPANRITGIINGERNITADTAARLSKLFNVSIELWLNLQQHYDLQLLEYSGERERIEKEVRELVRP